MKTSETVCILSVTLLLLGCGTSTPASDGGIAGVMATPEFEEACSRWPSCMEPRRPSEDATESIWRVLVVRSASGEIHFGQIDSVRVPEGSGVPLGPPVGEYVLAGLDSNGKTGDAQMIQFPTEARFEAADRAAAPEVVDLTGREVSTVGYLRTLSSLETLVVYDESGERLASTPAQSSQAARVGGLTTPAFAAITVGNSVPLCSHVVILEGEADRHLLGNSLAGEVFIPNLYMVLTTPGPKALTNILAGLGRMTPLLCHGISRIAYGNFEEGSGSTGLNWQIGLWGDTIMINARYYSEAKLAARAYELDLQHTVIHEAGHATEALLGSVGESLLGATYLGHWERPSREIAKATIDRVRLAKGLGSEWRRVHASFVSLGWAADEVPEGATASQLVSAGFISEYAARYSWEDIADTIAWAYMHKELAGDGNSVCKLFQTHSDANLPSKYATLYTKLSFLNDLGLVEYGDFRNCVGNLQIPITSRGFERWKAGTMQGSFTSNVEAGIGSKFSGVMVFHMTADGQTGCESNTTGVVTTYPAKITMHLNLDSGLVTLDEVPWPRGVYQLGSLYSGNVFKVDLEGNGWCGFSAIDGYVLVVEASNDRIVGSVFLRTGLGLNGYAHFDPPRIVRFQVKK